VAKKERAAADVQLLAAADTVSAAQNNEIMARENNADADTTAAAEKNCLKTATEASKRDD
jgi:hypothetical protein